VLFGDTPSANSRGDRAEQVVIHPDKLTEDGEQLEKSLMETGPSKALAWDKMFPHPHGDRWLVANMARLGWRKSACGSSNC
jgi:hypothetical protein